MIFDTCPNGHDLTGPQKEVYIFLANNTRVCRICQVEKTRKSSRTKERSTIGAFDG